MSKPISVAEVAEEILQSVLASPQQRRNLLSRTLWGKFGFRVRTESRIRQVAKALQEHHLTVSVDNCQFGKEPERARVALNYDGEGAPMVSKTPTPPESWFLKLEQRVFESESEVEIYFVIPLLEQLGYEEADIYVSYPMIIRPGAGRRRLKIKADIVAFNGSGRHKDDALLVVEAKGRGVQLNKLRAQQARSYSGELHTPYCVLTNGDEIRVLLTVDENNEYVIKRTDLRREWPKLFSLLNKQAVILQKQNQGAPFREKSAVGVAERIKPALLALLLAIGCCSAFADDTNVTLTVDGMTYSNVVFGTVTPYAVNVRHAGGIASVPLAKLPPDLQKRFGYDPQKAATYSQAAAEQARKQAAIDRQRAAERAANNARTAAQAASQQQHATNCTNAIPVIATVQDILPNGLLINCNAHGMSSSLKSVVLIGYPNQSQVGVDSHFVIKAYQSGTESIGGTRYERWVWCADGGNVGPAVRVPGSPMTTGRQQHSGQSRYRALGQ